MSAARARCPVARAHERLLLASGDAELRPLLTGSSTVEPTQLGLFDTSADCGQGILPELGAKLRERLTGSLLRALVRRAAAARGLDVEAAKLRLFAAIDDCDQQTVPELAELFGDGSPERIGALHELATALEVAQQPDGTLAIVAAAGRKQRGVFFTPPELTRRVAALALESVATRAPELRVCDPAVGAGAFLLAVCRQLASRGMPKSDLAARCLYGVDRSELAIAVAEACLWLEVSDPTWDPRPLAMHLRAGDSLVGFDWAQIASGGFDLVIGNPPWVAYAGRAAQPLLPETRAYYARNYQAFRGYPTLHGMFVERAAKLAPRGVVALLLPSPIADLAGYAPVRRALSRTHTAREPLLELGQDAFDGVTQPCFALIADPVPDRCGDREWRLTERQRSAAVAEQLEPPELLARLSSLPNLPRELFGEMGFQSAGNVSKTLLLRAERPANGHDYPLLEGKDVGEFRQGPARLFLRPDSDALVRARCRLRPAADYGRVAFVVRQTAIMPIAALHSGSPFRNTLLAGFHDNELSPALMVALLNSSLYRALHVARRRDARQAAFPQVKIAHLRALPRPPENALLWSELAELTLTASAQGMSGELRSRLDRLVLDLFDVPDSDRRALLAFLTQRGIRPAP
jgi:hypothetical protein